MLQKIRLNKKLLIAGVLVAIVAALLIVFFVLRPIRDDKSTAPTDTVVRYSTDTPGETKPAADYKWNGAVTDPKKIVIPSLKVDSYIQNVGVDQRKEVAVPDNIHLAGWFVDSVRPGEKGLSIIDGHLNGPQQDGIFINLENIKTNDIITIEFGDGSKKSFKVKTVQTVPANEAANILYSQDPKVISQLNLITCGGNFDSTSRLYDKRVIVSTVLNGI